VIARESFRQLVTQVLTVGQFRVKRMLVLCRTTKMGRVVHPLATEFRYRVAND